VAIEWSFDLIPRRLIGPSAHLENCVSFDAELLRRCVWILHGEADPQVADFSAQMGDACVGRTYAITIPED
jgi:hypothetical protein